MFPRSGKRIGVDIDGVLADYVNGYCDLVRELVGKEIPREPSCWDWAREAGVTREEDHKIWDYIIKNPNFWYNLVSLPGADLGLRRLAQAREEGDHVFFLTHRPDNARLATEAWLADRWFDNPPVILAEGKAPLARVLELDAFIDDKPGHCEAVQELSPRTRVFCQARSYNAREREAWTKVGKPITPVGEVVELFDWLEAEVV